LLLLVDNDAISAGLQDLPVGRLPSPRGCSGEVPKLAANPECRLNVPQLTAVAMRAERFLWVDRVRTKLLEAAVQNDFGV
jgi:hypothetical protein